jgi:2-alkyl-3-oxoalkanoate reductase
MTTLLTGGSGFLGSHIAEQLSARGEPVRALVRASSNTKLLKGLAGVETVSASFDDVASLTRALSGVKRVIHAAGLVKAKTNDEFHRVNAQGAINLLEAVRQTPGIERLVLVSSLSVAGPSEDGKPIPVESFNPVTHYGRSKLAAERAYQAAKADVPITIIRPPLIYGPRDQECFAFFKAVQLGVFPFMGSLDRGFSATYAGDCAAACIAAAFKSVPSGSTYFVEDGATQSLGQLIGHIEKAMNKRAWLRIPVPRKALEVAAFGSEIFGKLTDQAVMLTRDKCNELYASHWVCDATTTRKDLDWQPQMTFEKGAKVTLDWYRANNWLP